VAGASVCSRRRDSRARVLFHQLDRAKASAAAAVHHHGEAVQEFQEQSMLPFTELKSAAWLRAIGLNPSLEAVSVQLLVIVFALATYSVVQRNNRLARESRPAMRTAKPQNL
jgi:high-affinity iron transporter